MWGPWLTGFFGVFVGVLLIVGIAFGTSALLFPVLIAAAIGILIAIAYVFGGVGRREAPTPDPVADAAPASGEGGSAAPHAPGPDPSGVR
jgi:hypothetical protein